MLAFTKTHNSAALIRLEQFSSITVGIQCHTVDRGRAAVDRGRAAVGPGRAAGGRDRAAAEDRDTVAAEDGGQAAGPLVSV